MLQMAELLEGKHTFASMPVEVSYQLADLLKRLNWLEQQDGNPVSDWVVTSCYRSMDDQLRIYRDKAAKKQKPFEDGVFDEAKVPKASKHLYGRAVDIYDPGLKITKWLLANPKLLEEAGLWCEEGNTNWVHFQNKAHGSWKPGEDHWFKP